VPQGLYKGQNQIFSGQQLHCDSLCGRLAGVELPTFANTEASFPELEERVAKTIEFIKAIKPAHAGGERRVQSGE
jgi:hypothetical protein